ncbi:MaoC family dehydratase [Streptomyces sp. B1866]|uniref:MaoC family dehydratase n=1 Tax=Streptomyces sp. B1866 TaxID=3075431 RepID=UPI0028906721|nr:MaoC family dehydratase [Streptomyces sp. B1866]MDT3399250.1 MaoC family dehydratase [Streptomyces sp. B1866]
MAEDTAQTRDTAQGRTPPTGYETVGDRRYREVVGFHYEEFTVGDVIEHRPGRTVTEMDNVLMSMLSMNDAPLHIDAAYCADLPWGRPLVSSLVTLSIVGGMTARSTSGRALANLGWDHIRLPNPVFPGDTLYAESEVLAKRLSRSRPGEGIVTCRTTGTKATGEVVLVYERSFLVPCRARPRPAPDSRPAAESPPTAESRPVTGPAAASPPAARSGSARPR